MMDSSNQPAGQQPKHWQNIVVIIALILTLVAGASFRLVGVNWDENQHMHPDERFLSLVWNVIVPVDNLGDYFNTETSTLNPANQGYGFFVLWHFAIVHGPLSRAGAGADEGMTP